MVLDANSALKDKIPYLASDDVELDTVHPVVPVLCLYSLLCPCHVLKVKSLEKCTSMKLVISLKY